MVTVVESTIDTIKNMLSEINEKVDRCENQDILPFAKIIGEQIAFATDRIIGSTTIGSAKKLELGEEILRLEDEFGEINEKFNRCKCRCQYK